MLPLGILPTKAEMIEIGKYNRLRVARRVDFGMYLTDGSEEVLLPTRYIPEGAEVGDELRVFVYNDSSDRPIATTEIPKATVGEVAMLQVVATGPLGAFLEWGLPKDILVPLSEQRARMKKDGLYPVYVYLDYASKRIVASAKIEKFIGNVVPRYRKGDKVKAFVWKSSALGMVCVVDNLHSGLLYADEIFRPLEVGTVVDAWVMKVRDDGKIDIRLTPVGSGRQRSDATADKIVKMLNLNSKHQIPLTDKSDPEEIKFLLHCSKREFKQAVGHLLKSGRVTMDENGISMVGQGPEEGL